MSLAERRIVKELQDVYMPKFQVEFSVLTGTNIPLEINWDKLASTEDSAGYLADAIEKIFFIPLIEGLKPICADDMGKEALKDSLKKIVITNEGENIYAEYAITFESGILRIDHTISNVDNIQERTEMITKVLEAGL